MRYELLCIRRDCVNTLLALSQGNRVKKFVTKG